jgi:hypothetical protein
VDLANINPALPAGHPFMNVAPFYWSSTTNAGESSIAWYMDILGFVSTSFKTNIIFVTAVRGGS